VRQARASGVTVFLGVVIVVMAGYTYLAMGMEWRTEAGRIGAGFFPRVVGFATLALCIVAAVQSLRPARATDKDEDEDEDVALYPRMLLAFVGAGVLFLLALLPLGAIIASALFLFATLWFLNRGRLVGNLAVAVLLPIALYLLFQIVLNAGLPSGILPTFSL
jgi:putative tricarboxylic transport membrane protein